MYRNSVSASIVFGFVLVSVVACQQQSRIRPEAPAPETVSDGYGEKPKDQTSGGVHSVAYKDGPTQKVSSVEELLMGFPGVDVRRTGDGGYSVSIRGTGSFMSSEEPLYVIDGMQLEVKGGRGLGWLSPGDVVRIDVLKNPSETSIYGVRGSNGVIVITTKRPR